MKLFGTDLSEGTLLERLWHKTIGKLVQLSSLRYSGRTFVRCFFNFCFETVV